MVTFSLDGDALFAMLERRGRLMGMAASDMNDAQMGDVLKRLSTGPEFDVMVKRSLLINDGEIDE